MSTLERAIAIAAKAHAGQTDKAGQPYILHPLRVMLRMSGELERIVAGLHDVVEDTHVPIDQLKIEGFSPIVLDAVRALTKLPGETRLQAARRAAADPLARAVKLADNAENMDLSRIANPTEKDFARIKEYEEVSEAASELADALQANGGYPGCQCHSKWGSPRVPGCAIPRKLSAEGVTMYIENGASADILPAGLPVAPGTCSR